MIGPGSDRSTKKLIIFALLSLGAMGCATSNPDDQPLIGQPSRPPEPGVSQTQARTQGEEPGLSATGRHSTWEIATRHSCDRLIEKARSLAEEGQTIDALRCLDTAVAELLTVPADYRIRQVYLDYLSEVLAEADALQRALEVESVDPEDTDELVELPVLDPPDPLSGTGQGEPPQHPEDPSSTLPASDLPLVLNPTVERFLEAFTREGEYRERVRLGLERSGAYLPMIRERLTRAELPLDLAYLPLIESAFSSSAYSRARAVGMWQFISGTARAYGLDVGPLLDERRDPVLSTQAAVDHLGDLFEELGDWYLALAAYNSGAGNVRRAIRRSGSRDFWVLRRHLPRETRNYVPAFLASIIVAKRPAQYGMPEPEEAPWSLDRVDVPDALDLDVLAQRLELPTEELRRLNPAIRRDVTPARTSTVVWVPQGRGPEAETLLASLPRDEWTPRLVHTVRKGESLYTIARRLGSSVAGIRAANHLRGSIIRPGQTLVVPRLGLELDRPRPSERVADGGVYKVRPSDTLWEISKAFGISLDRLCSANGLTRRSIIQPGQDLRIPGPGPARSVEASREATGDRSSTYRVRNGDTLYGIARRFGVSVAALRRANQLDGSRIYPGDLLQIPS